MSNSHWAEEDDFSHLPTVDAEVMSAKQREAAALWKKHSRRQAVPHPEPEHTPEEVHHEQELVQHHELPPVEDLHPAHGHTHEPQWAEESYGQLPPETSRAEEHPADDALRQWARECFSEEFAEDDAEAQRHAAAAATMELGPQDVEAAAEAPAEEPADNTGDLQQARKRAWMLAIGVHVAVILILALIHTVPMGLPRAEIVAVSAVEKLEPEAWRKVTTAVPQAAPAAIQPMLATGVSDFAMPQVDFSSATNNLNLGTSMGSFGAGARGGVGGTVSFLGNKGSGKNIVFVVDVSGSMSATSKIGENDYISRFDLLKRELTKSIGQMKLGTQYQVLFFSDFAWPHDEVDSNDFRQLAAYEWSIRPGDPSPKIPRFKYITASAQSLRKSRDIIENATNPGGTNWGSGLLMALSASPRPDVIFFMTDGQTGDSSQWVNEVTQFNSRGRKTIIHTTAMMEPEAADDLADLARRNGGSFTVVMANGQVLKGDDFFKRRGGG